MNSWATKWPLRPQYAAIENGKQNSTQEVDDSLISRQSQSKSTLFLERSATYTIIILLTIFLTESTHRFLQPPAPSISRPSAGHCGNSSRESQALGCIFDPISISWLPSTCTFAGATEFANYRPNQPWQYWRDREGQDPISLEDFPFYPPDEKFFTTNGEHVTHCAFSFFRMAELLRTGGPADWMVSQYKHNVHCALLLAEVGLRSESFDHIGSSAYVRYGTC